MGASTRLKAVLTAQWGNYGLPPGSSSFGIHAIVAAHYFDGAAYPVGGAAPTFGSRRTFPQLSSANSSVTSSGTISPWS